MKHKVILLSVLLAASVTLSAQDFRKFKVGLNLGYARPSGEGAKGGVLFTLEPALNLSNHISIGLRIEGAVVASGVGDDLNADLETKGLKSYTLNGQYYFSSEKVRPFVGVGLGLYSLASTTFQVDGDSQLEFGVSAENKFGFYPRIGFDAGHFTMSADYNLIPATEIGDLELKNSYLGIRIGLFIGGGKL